jgi:membrane protein YdbS with pleckstrin-like domain
MKLLKAIHLLGLSAFLGSIFSYIVMGIAAESQSLPLYLANRQLVLYTTDALTLPSLLLIMVSGILLALLRRRYDYRWLLAKFGMAVAMMVIAQGWIRPAIEDAIIQLAAGQQGAVYERAMQQEAIAGGINILLCLLLLIIAQVTWRFRHGQ